jgi:hypothetical protein
MNRQTFEIIAKYISSKNNVTIAFDKEGEGASADVEHKTIHLPKEGISERNVFSTLALLTHESGHIKHTNNEVQDKCVKKNLTNMYVINVMEDIRIDRKCFNILPNISAFYGKMYEEHCNLRKKDPREISFPSKVLATTILNKEGFREYGFDDVQQFIKDNNIEDIIQYGINGLENQDYPAITEAVDKIKKILKLPDIPQKEGDGKGSGDENNPLKEFEKLLRPDSMYSHGGEKIQGPTACQVGEVALDEQTVNQFKELLNVKERHKAEDGTTLDSDNLMAFFTENAEELFQEDVYVKNKKTKILFLLDASGSMEAELLDKQERCDVVAKCTERITRILDEVQQSEGLSVDWIVCKFEDRGCKILPKEGWRKEYGAGGGTNLAKAFDEAMELLEKDYTVDGKKIIIVMTDGDVAEYQIRQMKSSILQHNSEVKAMVIGVGVDPAGDMAENILGDNIILAEEGANYVILEAVRRLL